MRLVRRLAIALAFSSVAAGLPALAAKEPLPGAHWFETYILSGDGTMLHADVFRPAGLADSYKPPVILLDSTYSGSGSTFPGVLTPTRKGPNVGGDLGSFDTLIRIGHVFQRGYTLVQVTPRGWGASGGCDDLFGPGSQMDAKAAVEWAASQIWSTGKVAMWGLSNEAINEVEALAERPRGLAAIVPQSPTFSTYESLFMNRNRYPAGMIFFAYPFAGLLGPPSLLSRPQDQVVAANKVTHRMCGAGTLSGLASDDRATAFWQHRDFGPRIARSTVPVMLSMGFFDASVKPASFLDAWTSLSGPKRAWLGQFGHGWADSSERGDPAFVGRTGFFAEAMRFLDFYLKGEGTESDPPIEVQAGPGGWWRTEASWPPTDATAYSLPLLSGTYPDAPGNTAEGRTWLPTGSTPIREGGGGGSWTFTQDLPYDVHLAGRPELDVGITAVAPHTNLVVLLYDVSPDGTALLVTRGASIQAKSGHVSFDLYPQDWLFRAGHRIGILMAGSDDFWFAPGVTRTTVIVAAGSMRVPFLAVRRVANLDGGPSQALKQETPIHIGAATIASRTAFATLPPPLK